MVLLGNEVRGEPASLVEVERTVRRERRHHRGEQPSERVGGSHGRQSRALPVPAWADQGLGVRSSVGCARNLYASYHHPGRTTGRRALAYAEAFVGEDDDAREARAASHTLGIAPVSQGTSSLLTFLARLIQARAVVEIGTGTGVSSLALLRGMASDGILTSIDPGVRARAEARKALNSAGVATTRRARLIAGAALDLDAAEAVVRRTTLVFVDGDPLEYVEYIDQAQRLLRSDGLLVLNHAFADGGVADETNEDDDTVIIRQPWLRSTRWTSSPASSCRSATASWWRSEPDRSRRPTLLVGRRRLERPGFTGAPSSIRWLSTRPGRPSGRPRRRPRRPRSRAPGQPRG